MGNREDLLAGAKRCLLEKGYARTTARDIATAAGTSLAAIGYHFGSKEQLLNAALYDATGEGLGEEFGRALRAAASGKDAAERFEATWTHMIDSLPQHRQVIVAALENLGQLAHVPELRETFAQAQADAIDEFTHRYRQSEHDVGNAPARAVATLYYLLMNGLIVQWMTDPGGVPSGEDLALAVRTIASAGQREPASDRAG
ncbi:TetR/AcrR family transcriptional regulator [Nonomuraea sp. KC401]|uniref:TetR/AcrR family transcriptional regulator n=1 Tax=unclassified Nonomuraea TaxID=2593643 RepID=UPI0010FEE6F5|nr:MULTISPECIES: TetR/AcrR family transcriptional regulator [unclassified Nonomuraea]NBE98443.1 TetR family transcriptional regulator [Nonomuraea sp. K271]TLF60996.1 TetR/AcrR family transcriptional regulator [Nonomuraea sp. KC401]